MKKCMWSFLLLAAANVVLVGHSHAQANKLVSSVLPISRAIVVNATATAFATIINTGTTTAQGCSIKLPAGAAATFTYQTTNPATNAVTGSPNTPVSIAAGAVQTFVFSIKPTATFAQTNIALQYTCTSGESAATITGVNTFLLTSSAQATPDVVALAATVSNDGVVRTPGTSATAAFSVASVNVGAAGTVVASVDSGANTGLPAKFTICQTNAQAACLQPPAASVTTTFAANQAGTFSIFVTSQGTLIPLDPATARVFVRFSSAANASFGASSVAVQTQTTLGEFGGSLQLGPVTVQAPAGAILGGTDFAATTAATPAALPGSIQSLNSTYDVKLTSASGVPDSGLNAPVKLTVPYGGLGVTDPNQVTVLHYDGTAGKYEPATIRDIDTQNQTVTFDSRQFSPFTLGVLGALNSALPAAVTVKNSAGDYSPSSNGFAIRNWGQIYLAPGGNCLGMSSFALWYFGNRGGQTLYSKYSTANNVDTLNGLHASVQDLVATLAHVNQSLYWANLRDTNQGNWQHTHPANVVFRLRAYLSLFGVPYVLIVGTAASPWAHAVLVYGYDANNFLIYDPNHPNTVTKLPYTSAGFGSYDGYTLYALLGTTSFGNPGTYNSLAIQADGGFTAASGITVTNPTQGSTVDSRQTQLTGALSAAVNGQSDVYFWKNGNPNFTLAGTTNFNKQIDVASGLNTIVLLAGVTAYGATLSNSLLNAVARIITFSGPNAAKFRATLTWNQSNTDVDQYVTEPTGATAWYAGRNTAAGLRLDFDNTSGFGPENTTIEGVSTPIPGVYKVRLHYYSDHGTKQTTTGNVVVTLNERETNQVGPVSKLWSLSISDSSNDDPGKTGADWVDIADVNVVTGTITLR